MSAAKTIFISADLGREEAEHLAILARLLDDLGYEAVFQARADMEIENGSDGSLEEQQARLLTAKAQIVEAQCLIVDGSGSAPVNAIEAGVAWGLGKPVIILNPGDEDTSPALEGIATDILMYSDYADLKERLQEILPKVHGKQ